MAKNITKETNQIVSRDKIIYAVVGVLALMSACYMYKMHNTAIRLNNTI